MAKTTDRRRTTRHGENSRSAQDPSAADKYAIETAKAVRTSSALKALSFRKPGYRHTGADMQARTLPFKRPNPFSGRMTSRQPVYQSTGVNRTAGELPPRLPQDPPSTRRVPDSEEVLICTSSSDTESDDLREPPPRSRSQTAETGPSSPERSRASGITPCEGRCLITNVSVPSTAITTHHIVSVNSMNLGEFERLRRQWCLRRPASQSSIDRIGGNILHLRGDWALMFSNHSWTLLPDPKILLGITQKLISLKKRQRNAQPRDVRLSFRRTKHAYTDIQVSKHNEYEYTFVALDLQGAQIARETSPETIAAYAPPYSSFPNLSLPAHPYLVIHHALQAFEKHDPSTGEHIRIHNDMLRIKKLWTELERFSADDGDTLHATNGSARDRVNTRRHTMANPYPTPRNV